MSTRLSSTKKRLTVIVVAAALILLGGGAAFAYWTSSGQGVGTATTGTSVVFIVASTAATGDPLTPGGPTQTVAFTVTNPSSGVQQLANVTVTVANAGGAEWTRTVPGPPVLTCTAADYTVGVPDIVYGSLDPGETVDGTVTITMDDTGANQDGCKGATVPLYFLAS
ncbi:hypothetical protein ACVBEQ_22480 [Nakamurella sp. GG22]